MRVHRYALTHATDAQLTALRDHVLKRWDHIPDEGITIIGEGTEESPGMLMVYLRRNEDDERPFTIGIHPEGSCHS